VNQVFQNSECEVHWCGGGVLVRGTETSLLLDCPVGVEHYLGELAGELDAVVLTSGRIQAIGGLIGLLESVSRHKRRGELTIYSGLGDEKGPALVDCWTRDWRSAIDIHLDLSTPGRVLPIGGASVRTESVPHSEPLWCEERVVSTFGNALRVQIGATSIAWVPGAGRHPIIGRLCQGANLAIIEIAGVPWPAGGAGCRLTREEALRVGAMADAVWLVTDAGERVGTAQA
jgi:hypothetical protein